MVTPTKSLEVKIHLAYLANGGTSRELNCECDPDSNAAPCRWCAINDALESASKAITQARAEERERFKAQEELLEECEKLLSRDIVFQAERMALLTKLQERKK